MHNRLTCGALSVVFLFVRSLHFGDEPTVSKDRLSAVREACGVHSLESLDCDAIQKSLLRTRWRNSLPDVIRYLISSQVPKESEVGWRLSEMQGVPQKWTKPEVDRVLADSNERLKWIAIRSISVTDPVWSSECIERILLDPMVTEQCQRRVLCDCLAKVANLERRTRLWSIAATKDGFQEECLSTFPLVSSSAEAVVIATKLLGDKSLIRITVSNHFAVPVEVRVFTAMLLGRLVVHQEIAFRELCQRCPESPPSGELTFAVESMVAARHLSPDATVPAGRLTRWFRDIPESREIILDRLEGAFPNERELEGLVIDKKLILSPEEIASFCRWLSCQRASPQGIRYLKDLLKHDHPGVRAAAVVALGVQDPLYDFRTIKDNLLKSVCESPEKFAMPFEDLESAFTALAFAGATDDEALQWLRSQKSPEVIALARSAIDDFTRKSSLFADTPTARDTPWAQRPFMRRSRSGE